MRRGNAGEPRIARIGTNLHELKTNTCVKRPRSQERQKIKIDSLSLRSWLLGPLDAEIRSFIREDSCQFVRFVALSHFSRSCDSWLSRISLDPFVNSDVVYVRSSMDARLQMRIWEAVNVPGKALPGGRARRRASRGRILKPIVPVALSQALSNIGRQSSLNRARDGLAKPER